MALTQAAIPALAAYALLGVAFALPFALRGVTAIDPNARTNAPWGFRLLILPGAAALWPWLLLRWIRARKHAAAAQPDAAAGAGA